MIVLSLFDGMSCGRVALERCGFKIDNYFASEIDKYAIQVALTNYPDTIQIGDVTKVKAKDLPQIDLVIGGSPCQGFSFAGKQLNFEDPRSKLFFEFVRLVKECKPKYFFLENVKMKKEYQDVISKYLGVEPVLLCSSLVSAQTRKRLYWTNIPGYSPPTDKGILLKDIVLEYATTDKDKSNCLTANFAKQTKRDYAQKSRGQIVAQLNVNPSGKGMNGLVQNVEKGKLNCLTTNKGEGPKVMFNKATIVGRRLDSEGTRKDYDRSVPITQVLEVRRTTVAKDNVLTSLSPGRYVDVYNRDYTYRKLTPIECERLQTVPDNYTAGVSNSQRYRMLGNGWTVDAICEFFKHIPSNHLDLF